jgi:adenosine kinase
MSIIVTGAIALDILMYYEGTFQEYLADLVPARLQLRLAVQRLVYRPGGGGANICYSLGLLGEHPMLLASVGKDFEVYRSALERVGVDVSNVRILEGETTGTAFIITDLNHNQIAFFYPGAIRNDTTLRLQDVPDQDISYVIIAPTDPKAMVRFVQEARLLAMPYVYAPGQQVVALSADELRDGILGAAVIIVNEYEYILLADKTGLSKDQLLSTAEMLIVTSGEDGSVIHSKLGEIEIPIALPRSATEPTGAGDAYTAGFVFALQKGIDLPIAGRVGALAATYAIEASGAQGHYYDRSSFSRRFAETFGFTMPL